MRSITFKGTLKDLKAILERLIEKYGGDITIYEMIIKEYGKEEVALC